MGGSIAKTAKCAAIIVKGLEAVTGAGFPGLFAHAQASARMDMPTKIGSTNRATSRDVLPSFRGFLVSDA
jgi:hypothetical protein